VHALYGWRDAARGVRVDAVAVAYDHAAFARDFEACWPAGSAAHASYFEVCKDDVAYKDLVSEQPRSDCRRARRTSRCVKMMWHIRIWSLNN